MAKFKFRLKTILNLKKQIEEQAKLKFGQAMAMLNHELAILHSFENAVKMTMDEFRIISGGVFTVNRIKEYNLFITKMREKVEEQKLVVAEAEAYVDEVRKELVYAMQQREMFDKIREKEYERYTAEEKHNEQIINDEIISFKIGSNLNGKQSAENETRKNRKKYWKRKNRE